MRGKFSVGLTGGIGSGKTTVSDMFAELGAGIIDADKITHELQKIDQPAYQRILENFGPDIIDENRELRRDYLRRLIFNDKALKNRLEGIVHPLVRSEINRRIDTMACPYCIISIPLLFETGVEPDFDRILVVDIPEHLQVQRTSSRDNADKDEIMKIINAQINRRKRLEMADDIICNDKDLDNLRLQVTQLHKIYLQYADKVNNA